MKTRNLKITLLSLIIALCAFISLGVLAITPARAETFTPTKDDFYMLDGAQIRDTEESSGIRFVAYLSDAYVSSLGVMGEDYEVGMAIIPRSEFDATASADTLDETTPKVALQSVGSFVSDENPNYKEGYNAYTMSLVNIPNTVACWQDKTIANAYVKDLKTNTYTFVTDIADGHAQERDIATVATNAYADGFEADIVDTIVQNISVGKTVQISAENLSNRGNVILGIGGNANVTSKVLSGSYETTYAAKYTSSDPSVATVDSTGKITAISNGSAVISANFGSVKDDQKVFVYKDTVYDFETTCGESLLYQTDAGLTSKGPSSAQNGFARFSRTSTELASYTVPDEFGDYCFRAAAANDNYRTFGISMDYLEYAFSKSNTACVVFDLYSTGSASTYVQTYNCTDNTQAVSSSVTDGDVHSLGIWREEFNVMKEFGDTELKIGFNTGKTTKKGLVDNLKIVTWDELFGVDNTYGFDVDYRAVVNRSREATNVTNGIFYPLKFSSNKTVVNGVVDDGSDNKVLKGTSSAQWGYYGISMSFMDWAFGVKGAKSVTFEMTNSKSGSIWGCVSTSEKNVSITSCTADTATTVTIAKETWSNLKAHKETLSDFDYITYVTSTAAANVPTTTVNVRRAALLSQAATRISPVPSSGGCTTYFDNIKLVFS